MMCSWPKTNRIRFEKVQNVQILSKVNPTTPAENSLVAFKCIYIIKNATDYDTEEITISPTPEYPDSEIQSLPDKAITDVAAYNGDIRIQCDG